MTTAASQVALEAALQAPASPEPSPAIRDLLPILDEVLHLGGRAAGFGPETQLLGALPELDSMAVVGLITRIQERFSFVIEDDEIEGATFATVGSLAAFVNGKLESGARS